MKFLSHLLYSSLGFISLFSDLKQGNSIDPPSSKSVKYWLTSGDRKQLLSLQSDLKWTAAKGEDNFTIKVNQNRHYQTIDGFGYTLTGGSATLINKLPEKEKTALLKELFSPNNGIGINYIRLSIGASDLSANLFTYNDLPVGETDFNQDRFTLDQEKKDLIPILKRILAIQPKIKILGSPWTAPLWMKDNKAFKGGNLLPNCYDAYARYFVKYIKGMKDEGISIDAITIQNEPLHPGNTPSMYMSATEQAKFIKQALGPTFEAEGIKTKIIIYDHNADRPDYPLSILSDPEANKYIDGSAFHLYGGKINALSQVHEAFPNKSVYFTEQWVGGPGNFPADLKWHVSTLIIGATRNWSRNVLEWNLAADANYEPHTDDGGCKTCLGALTIAPDISRNVAYYVIAHASKFVPPGSTRIESNLIEHIPNVAFKTPNGKRVLIAINTASETKQFNIQEGSQRITAKLDGGTVATFVW